MKKFKAILLLLSLVFCYVAAQQNTNYSCTKIQYECEQISLESSQLTAVTPTAQVVIPTNIATCINSAHANTPTCHQHAVESSCANRIRKHFLIFVATLAITTDAVSAHYYIIALRRIIR